MIYREALRASVASYVQLSELILPHITKHWSFGSNCPVRNFGCNYPSYSKNSTMNPEFEAYWKPELLNEKTKKLVFQPAERNKQPILETLQQYIDSSTTGNLLEISSGSGQHVAHISREFPRIVFQPSDIEEHFLSSIKEYIKEENLPNVRQPLHLNVDTPVESWANGILNGDFFDFILVINLLHVAPWSCSEGLFKGCSTILKPNGLMFIYGAFSVDGVISPESNVKFHANLKEQDPRWGIRDVHKELLPLASKFGMELMKIHDLPSSNRLLAWKKKTVS